MATTIVLIDGPTIPAGESLSDAVDCSAGRISRITMPSEGWDNANLSFEVSSDGVEPFFNPLYHANGDQYTVVADKGHTILINQQEYIPGMFIKIRSGTYGVHVPQSQERKFALALLVDTP